MLLKKDENGVWIVGEGEIFSNEQDPNLSGPPFQVVSEGDGDYVELTGFGIGDPTKAKARALSIVRGVYTDYPVNTGSDEGDVEARTRLRSYASVVLGTGEKFDLGPVAEA